MHVADYFRKKYNINLRYTSLPALNAGTDAKPIYMPMEVYTNHIFCCFTSGSCRQITCVLQVCKIVKGQRCAKKLNERQVTNLLKATCQRPIDREASIMEVWRFYPYYTSYLYYIEKISGTSLSVSCNFPVSVYQWNVIFMVSNFFF